MCNTTLVNEKLKRVSNCILNTIVDKLRSVV
jgi:hypothetical protein